MSDMALLHGLPETEDGVDFLHPQFLDRMNRLLRWDKPMTDACLSAMKKIHNDPEQRSLAWKLHRRLFAEDNASNEAIAELKEAGDGKLAAVVYLSGLPSLIKRYSQWGIGEQVLADTLNDFAIWIHAHQNKYGEWGLSELGWLILHLKGKLFRLGRLQFISIPYGERIRAYRSRLSGSLAVLSEGDVPFRRDGQINGTNAVIDHEGGWISTLREDDSSVTGHPIDPAGYALQETVTLRLAEWEPVLKPGDTVLDVHIPEGAPLAYELCRESYERAGEFWAEHFPGTIWRAFVSSSWLLGPQLKQLLPETSNIIRFQNDYCKIPVLSDDKQTMERVFGRYSSDPSELPRNTTLRRTIAAYVSDGNPIHGAAGFKIAHA